MTRINVADRCRETTTSTGTGTINLAGAVQSYRTFVNGIGSGNHVQYCIAEQAGSNWETGRGIVTAGAPDTLSRDTVFDSSNGGSLVNFGAGTKDVFGVFPAHSSPVANILNADMASFANVFTNITNMSLTVEANDIWQVNYIIRARSSNAGATGVTFQLTIPAGTTGNIWGFGNSTADNLFIGGSADLAHALPFWITTGSGSDQQGISLWAQITVGATAGTIQLQGKSGAAGTSIIVAAGTQMWAVWANSQ